MAVDLNMLMDLREYDSEGDVITPRIERVPLASLTPIPKDPMASLAQAAKATAALMGAGMHVEMSEDEEDMATDIFQARETLTADLAQNASIVLKLSALLSEYDHQIIKDADQIRRYTTNRLLEMSNHPSPNTQMRALELLGKISEVGLFAERTIITVQHQTTDQIQAELKKTIDILLDPEDYTDITAITPK